MLAINTQLSGLIMWNCGKFTWGSGTNDIRVWPCFSEMAPAPAAGTRRLPKKIWSHFVLLDASPSASPSLYNCRHPSPFPIALSLFPFPSHFALKFVNLSGFFLCSSFFCFSHSFFYWQTGTPTTSESHAPSHTGSANVNLHPSGLITIFPASLPVQHLNGRQRKGEDVIQMKMISLDFGSGQTVTCVLAV